MPKLHPRTAPFIPGALSHPPIAVTQSPTQSSNSSTRSTLSPLAPSFQPGVLYQHTPIFDFEVMAGNHPYAMLPLPPPPPAPINVAARIDPLDPYHPQLAEIEMEKQQRFIPPGGYSQFPHEREFFNYDQGYSHGLAIYASAPFGYGSPHAGMERDGGYFYEPTQPFHAPASRPSFACLPDKGFDWADVPEDESVNLGEWETGVQPQRSSTGKKKWKKKSKAKKNQAEV